MVAPAEARGRGRDPGVAGGPGPRRAAAGAAGVGGDRDLLPQPGAIGWTIPSYRAQGWQIGSGPVEAACKTVIGQRMKGSGMRWGHEGADAVCHLRALLLSEKGQWDAFWAHRRKAA